jgi:hypothetical protein
VPKVCQNPMFFDLLGLTSSEKHIPQVDENTVKPKCQLDALEWVVTRRAPRLPWVPSVRRVPLTPVRGKSALRMSIYVDLFSAHF